MALAHNKVAGSKKPLASDVVSDDDATPQNVMGTSSEPNPTQDDEGLGAWLGQSVGNRRGNRPRAEYLAFADALRKAMVEQNLTASEVARRVWGTSKDRRGYDVAKNRDRVGLYLAGTSYPEPANLEKLAAAVGVPVDELRINGRPPPAVRAPRNVNALDGLDMQLIFTGDLNAARLMINRTVPTKLAIKIIEMLRRGDDGDHGEGEDHRETRQTSKSGAHVRKVPDAA